MTSVIEKTKIKRLEVIIDGVSQGNVYLRLNGDLKVTKVSKKLSAINNTCLLNIGAHYVGFDFKSYETALEKGLEDEYKEQTIKVKENPLPRDVVELYKKSLYKTGRL